MAPPPAALVNGDSLASGSRFESKSVERNVVLLVEDDDTVAGLVTHILKRAQRQVLRARDGAEGVRFFGENVESIGLVILDCRLPDSDGPWLCRELRKQMPDVPVLLTSGRDHSDERVLDEGGRTAFLQKPFRPVDVELKVASLLGAIA